MTTGSIKIDGIDIASLGLRQLRSKLAIIPQDPKMFAGWVAGLLSSVLMVSLLTHVL